MTAQSEGFTRYRAWDFEATEPDALPAASALSVLPVVLEPGRQAGRPRVRALRSAAIPSRSSKSDATSRSTNRSRCGTRPCRPPSRRSSPPKSAMSNSRTNTSARLRSSTCAISPATPVTAFISPRLRARGSLPLPGFGGLRDYGDVLSFAPTLPAALRRLSFGLLYRQRRLRVEVVARSRAVHTPRRRAAGPAPPRSIGHARSRCPDDACLGHRPAGTRNRRTSEAPGAIAIRASAPRSRPIGMSAQAIPKSCRFWRVEHEDGPPICLGSEGRSQPESWNKAGAASATKQRRTNAHVSERERVTGIEPA